MLGCLGATTEEIGPGVTFSLLLAHIEGQGGKLVSEPDNRASKIEALLPGLLHWQLQDNRVEEGSHAYALVSPHGTVLVDPLPLEPAALAQLENVEAICLTIGSHQRSAWRFRKHFAVPVYAPKGAFGLLQQPDVWYATGQELPGGLYALHAPGPCDASYALLGHCGPQLVLFSGDLIGAGLGGLAFVDDRFQEEPRMTRESVSRLAEFPIDVLLPGHAPPVVGNAQQVMRSLLDAPIEWGTAQERPNSSH